MAAAEETLDWVASPRRLAEIHRRRIDGRVRRCASQEGRALQACLDVGLRGDARLDDARRVARRDAVARRRLELRPATATCTHSSFNETWGPILGLAAYGATDAVARGAEFLLQHRVVFSHRTGEPAHPVLLKLHFPAYWHYDVLAGLRTLAARWSGSTTRAPPMRSISSSRSAARTGRGGPKASGGSGPARRAATSRSSTGATAANELLTEQAEGVLRGRPAGL